MSESMKRNSIIFVYFALILSTLLVFRQVCNFDFVSYDDKDYVYENPHVLSGLAPAGILWAFTSGHASNWHPLTWLSLMLDCQLFGPNPGRIHLVNLLLHLANTLLLFAVFKKMTGSLWPSAFVAAAFAIHPMHVESVAWIAERKDVLSTLFLLLTLAAYVNYVRRRSLVCYLLTVLLFVLGLLAKPMLVTLPFLLLLLDYWPLDRFTAPRAVKAAAIADKRRILYRIIIEKIPFFVLAAASSVITFIVQKSSGAVSGINTISLQSRIANVFLSYIRYLGKLFWPQNLAVFYPFDADSFTFWQVAMCILPLLVISIFVIRLGRNQKYLLVGWFWFVGTLVPVIGLVQVGSQAYADRYTYIPYIGLFIIIAWGLPEFLSKWPQRKIILGLLIVIVLTTLGLCAHQQVSHWKNGISLFTHALKVTQDNYVAYNNLGAVYSRLGRHQDAIEAYKQAIRIKPTLVEAYYNVGAAYAKLGRWQDAIEPYRQAIRIKPDYVEAHNNLGAAYDKLDRWQEAIEAFSQARKIKPDDVEAHYNLGIAYGKLDRWQEAIEAYKQAVKIKPDYAEAYNNLGVACGRFNRYQDAIEAFKQAIRIKPDYAEAYYDLGFAYGTLGRYQDAIDALKQAIRIKPDDADTHYNLGLAYLMTGNKGSALEEYKILKTLDAERANNLFILIHE
jgi:tetratricopeptide (TPR) repeat protein